MNWTQIGIAILASAVGASLTDWLFMGVLFHEKYLAYPEVWRDPQGKAEGKKIAWSTVFGVISCAMFVLVCARLGLVAWMHAMKLAGAVWLIAALPILVSNFLWIKMHPLTLVSHLGGWLARLMVCAAAVALLLQ